MTEPSGLKVLVYPADNSGCGWHRMIYPSQLLIDAGHAVEIVHPRDRSVSIAIGENNEVENVNVPPGTDVIVFQRPTDHRLAGAIKWLREKGHTVVVDIDDDLSSIHPSNPAWTMLDPNRIKREMDMLSRSGKLRNDKHAGMIYAQMVNTYTHSWTNLLDSCKRASMVTVSTPGLLRRYAGHGRGRVLHNYVADDYLYADHKDSDLIVWPAALHSHPNDPQVVGNSIQKLIDTDGARFICIGPDMIEQGDASTPSIFYADKVAEAFALRQRPGRWESVEINEWVRLLERVGIGIVPLADTAFNRSKSWLKGIELAGVGIPFVASPRAEYIRLHKLGVGMLADRPKDWYRALRQLVQSDQLRIDVAERGRQAVEENLRLRDHAWRWAEAWQDAWKLDHTEAPTPATVIA